MAFLFKSKKEKEKTSGHTREPNGGAGSQGSIPSNGRINEKQATPTSSVNNSLASLPEKGAAAVASSPEQQMTAQRIPQPGMSDLPLRNLNNGNAPPVQSLNANPNASLYPWSQKRLTYTSSHPSPFPRYGAAVNAVASKEGDIYMMGGLINSSTVKGDLWMVEAGAGNMACYPLATTAEGPGPRVGHASLLVGNAFIVYGGDTKMDDSDVLDETLYLLNTSTRQWSRAVPAGPRPSGRYGHSLNILGSKIYVFGGQVEGYFMNDLVAFDLNQLQIPANRWEFLIKNSDEGGPPVGQIPPARTNHTVVTYNEKLYLFGGTNGYQWFNDVWSYDPSTNAWTQLDCIGYIPAPREGHAAALVDDVMYIFGGRTDEGADLGDLAAFRITSRRWYTFQNMGPSPSPRSGHSMTANNKQIVVLAGEPSSATSTREDLSIVYVLDTSKIRYPNDQQIQSTPTGERVPGARRPSGGEKTGMGAIVSRGLNSREGPPQSALPQPGELKKQQSVPPREAPANNQNQRQIGQPGVNGNDMNGVAPGSAQPQAAPGGGSKLPRASQAPSGPPPQAQAPNPKMNSSPPLGEPPKPKVGKGFGPGLDSSTAPIRSSSKEREPLTATSNQSRTMSPARDGSSTKVSPTIGVNGRRTPTEIPTKAPSRQEIEPPLTELQQPPSRSSSKTRQERQQRSIDSTAEPTTRARPSSPPPPTRAGSNSNPMNRKGSNRNSQSVALLKELEVSRNKNAWLASELELAKKSGYTPNTATSPVLDRSVAENFGEADRPLIEALIAMRTELANVQGSVDQQAVLAAKKIAEVEKQRDVAVNEAIYAKAKLAAHGGSTSSTPQPDEARGLGRISEDRSSVISRKLASAIELQRDLQHQVEMLTAENEAEKRARQLAEDTANAAQGRINDLESYKQNNSSEVERLKAELHELHRDHRQQGLTCAEAVAAAKVLHSEKEDLESRHKELVGTSKDHSDTFESLREAMAASAEMKNLLERKLDEERTQREAVEEKLRILRGEHEARTSELGTAQRKLKDAEEMAQKHAHEAQTHRQAVLSGLEKATTRDVSSPSRDSGKLAALMAQIETSNVLVKKHQVAADTASERLRSAEERIAGLEAYQEQVSREGLSIRKQLQSTMREVQTLQAANSDLKHQLANQQLESNAVNVQHNTLKDLLGERGISPSGAAARSRGLTSPQNRSATPDQTRLRDVEQQLAAAHAAHDETKATAAAQADAADASYREKLGQLESDYQSAVHYVKGTEKMLKRMKDELSRYKAENTRMKTELDDAVEKAASASSAKEVPAGWESERSTLQTKIGTLQKELSASQTTLEKQLSNVRNELQTSQRDRDFFKKSHTDSQEQLTSSMQQARADLSQLQQENALLERRAMDAEHKVGMLLDQVESSVDNYRRQSRPTLDMSNISAGAAHGHARNISNADSIGGDSTYSSPSKDRNSMALDSLASELETLRTHWETTNKNYRLSGASGHNYDFDSRAGAAPSGHAGNGLGINGRIDEEHEGLRSPPLSPLSPTTPKVELSSSLADWRKRLDQEEEAAARRKAGPDAGTARVEKGKVTPEGMI